jgi:hypothetical protein
MVHGAKQVLNWNNSVNSKQNLKKMVYEIRAQTGLIDYKIQRTRISCHCPFKLSNQSSASFPTHLTLAILLCADFLHQTTNQRSENFSRPILLFCCIQSELLLVELITLIYQDVGAFSLR